MIKLTIILSACVIYRLLLILPFAMRTGYTASRQTCFPDTFPGAVCPNIPCHISDLWSSSRRHLSALEHSPQGALSGCRPGLLVFLVLFSSCLLPSHILPTPAPAAVPFYRSCVYKLKLTYSLLDVFSL